MSGSLEEDSVELAGCRSILGEGTSVVAGAPPGFDLNRQLRDAARVRVATAFAHKSGWKLIRDNLLKGKTTLDLLTGLHFCQTEPAVLKEWLKLAQSRTNTRAFLAASNGPMFHPKVLIVEGVLSKFALVGSGNLSAGGLGDNVECWLYSDDVGVVRQVTAWFDTQLADPLKAQPLRAPAIATYLPKYQKAQKFKTHVRRLQREAEDAIVEEHEATMHRWKQAVQEAHRYFRTKKFRHDWSQRVTAIPAMRRALAYPSFEFGVSGWKAFYDILAFGHLIEINRDSTFYNHAAKLRAAFRHLVDEAIDIEDRLNDVLERGGSYRIPGVNLNIVTKVLLVHAPSRWPVFNGAVKKALRHFDYVPPRGASPGRKYLAYAELMERFRTESGAKKLAHLDTFFFHKFDANRD
jgi:hypothetical protein